MKRIVGKMLPALLVCLCGISSAATFSGDDLAIANEPYVLQLPADRACEISWGDGAVERADGGAVTHRFRRTGVAVVSVRVLREDGELTPATVDAVAQIAQARPCVFTNGTPSGAIIPDVLRAPADSFSIECRVQLDNPSAETVLFASKPSSQGACRFGIRQGVPFFALKGRGECAAPAGAPLMAGRWHHLAVTYDRVPLFPHSNRVRFFIDGLPAGDAAFDAPDPGAVVCSAATVGSSRMKGRISTLAVYDTLLSPVTIREHAALLAGSTGLAVTIAYPGASDVHVDEPAIARTVDVTLDSDPLADNGPALRKAIDAAGPGTRLRMVGAKGATGGVFHVRSLVAANKWAALIVEGKTDFELDGGGCTLVFSEKVARYLLIDACKRVAIRNLNFDLDPAYARVGVYAKLLDVDPATQIVKAQLVNGRNGAPDPVIPSRASWWRWRPHDPKTLRISEAGPRFNSDSYAERPVADPASGPGVIRFKLKEDAQNKLWDALKAYKAGPNFYVINNADFSANAVSLTGSSHVTFEHMNYYATLGMVFLSSGIDHLRVAHCKIGLPPGLTAADRPLSAGADGYHFHEMHGGILFEDNEIALTDDDPISIKDSVWPDVRKVGDDQLALGHPVKSGHPIELLNPDYTSSGFTATVTSVTGDVVTLDRPLPAVVATGSVLMDRSHHTTNWILRGNYLHDYYGRVMLYADHGTVMGNRIHGSFYHIGNSAAYFETAGAARNVIAHRNLFESTAADCSFWGGNRMLPAFHELTWSANSFVGKGLSLNNAADSLVARNIFEDGDGAIAINRCIRIQALHNDASIRAKESDAVVERENR